MLLSYTELHQLIEQGIISANHNQVNAASIELTLDSHLVLEHCSEKMIVDLAQKESISTKEFIMPPSGYTMQPGEFLLASTREVFNLPNDIVAEYVLKSSMARNGLNHLLAGYADPGWNNSKLTLELHNCNRNHYLRLTPGMKIGQMKFYRVKEVPAHASYAAVGQYNNQTSTQQSKGIR